MNFEPKVTDRAAFVALWHKGELLVLQSRKWQTEGTPYLLPGGGLKRADENPANCAGRELFEETGLGLLDPSCLKYYGTHKTEWTHKADFFELDFESAKTVFGQRLLLDKPNDPKLFGQEWFNGGLRLEEKFFGYEWWNFETDKKRIEALQPFMMPGLKWYLGEKGLL